ncbi:Bug family tripartite tricarboxylate transporter substrate binding protein [Mangrovicoccus algicola]|uniref:Tripartite tricarboxylate transporter substrate binding protein n=1 Tax=Mangrovicoccus algicola TaxID=2771008 RepID=A0A8J6YXM7_9RHOB|nr:tripartite tricarboxylate transporter substrate binding protein [Mangrovicoccus algicola]MBE3639592.1 tripartite tricarboxylate transporter substrate binding protein [Mangrovicoccus algicola]
MKRRHLISSALALSAAIGLAGPAAMAQDAYPAEPIHITVVWPAGGGHDLVGRLLGNELSKVMDTPVVVDNVTGAGGTTGMRHVADADPDGYTIGVMGLHAISQSFMNANAPTMEDVDPLVYISDDPGALEISADAGIDTLEDYVAAMKDDPMALMNGNDPQGGNSFVFANVIPKGLGIDMMKLPYPGHAPTVTALLTGEVQTATLPIPPVLEQAKAGTVKVLGVASEERHPQLPDVPTFKEQGYDIVTGDFVMIVGPKGMDPAVKKTLSDGILAAAQSAAFTEAATSNGMVLRAGGPEMAAAELTTQVDTVYPLLLDAGLVAEGLERE